MNGPEIEKANQVRTSQPPTNDLQGQWPNPNSEASASQSRDSLPVAVLQAHALGFSLIPANQNKKPYFAWKRYQREAAGKEILTQWAKQFKPPAWAVVTGAISQLVVLDFDGTQGKETLSRLNLEPHVQTGSGGFHVYFEHPGWPVSTLNSKTKVELGKAYPGLDIRADGGYAVFCGRNGAGPYRQLRELKPDPLSCVPDELKRMLGLDRSPKTPTIPAPRATKAIVETGKGVSYDHLLDRALERASKDGRNNSGFWLAIQLRDNGYSEAEAESIMRDYVSRVPPINAKGQREGYGVTEALASLRGAYSQPARESWSQPRKDSTPELNPLEDGVLPCRDLQLHPVIAELNKTHAIVMVGGKCAILNETIDPVFNRPDITFSSVQDFKTRYCNRYISEVSWGNYWLKHAKRRQYDGVVFAPKQATPNYFNLWRGFAYEPREGNCSGYLLHLHDNVAGEDEVLYRYILAWMADAVQNPGRRPGTSIVLRGSQGAGKGIACSEFGRLFGSHFIHVNSHRQLIGNFNAHLKDALVVFADEALWAGDKSHEGVLKFLVTEDILPIEFKGKDIFRVRNYIRLLVSSNNEWVVPAGLDERRFLVIDVGDKRKQDRAYFGEILRQMENGGRRALLYFLLNYDLSSVDLNRLPRTEALRETKIFTMNPVQKFWFDCLSRGSLTNASSKWESFIKCSQLHEEFVAFSEAIGHQRRASETELGIGLRNITPPEFRRVRKTILDGRFWFYQFPDLQDCREYFNHITNCQHPWPEE